MSSHKKPAEVNVALADTHLTDAEIKALALQANDPSSRISQTRFTTGREEVF